MTTLSSDYVSSHQAVPMRDDFKVGFTSRCDGSESKSRHIRLLPHPTRCQPLGSVEDTSTEKVALRTDFCFVSVLRAGTARLVDWHNSAAVLSAPQWSVMIHYAPRQPFRCKNTVQKLSSLKHGCAFSAALFLSFDSYSIYERDGSIVFGERE